MPDIDYGQILEALNDKVDLDGSWSAPTSQYDDLTLGATGSTYTAPADGYIVCSLLTTSDGSMVELLNVANGLCSRAPGVTSSLLARVFLPVRKGDIIKANYTNLNSVNLFRFIYAQKTN